MFAAVPFFLCCVGVYVFLEVHAGLALLTLVPCLLFVGVPPFCTKLCSCDHKISKRSVLFAGGSLPHVVFSVLGKDERWMRDG